MQIHLTTTHPYSADVAIQKSLSKKGSLDFLGEIINDIPTPIKEAISAAIKSANLKGRDKLIIPHALVMSAKISAQREFHTSIANLSVTQWKRLAGNTLANLGPHNMSLDPDNSKTRRFLEDFIAFL